VLYLLLSLCSILADWEKKTPFNKPEDWLFASEYTEGKLPVWFNTLMERHIRPGAKRLGIAKRIGWHTFRRSFASWLIVPGFGRLLKLTAPK
jgi:integrase